jgi:hypothetical protein
MEEKKVYKCEKCDKFYKNYKSLWKHNYIFHKDNNEEKLIPIKKIEEKKCICDKCNKEFKNLEDIKTHLKDDCRPSIKSNNIYTFKTETLGKYKYKNFNGGDIYIIQTEFNLKGFYKIGVSTDLYKRLGQYRCGSVLEPKLHYYYPCKNIKETDKLLKKYLQKFNIKREIYKADNIDDLRNAIKEIQKESDSLELEVVPENKECDITPCQYCDLYFTNKQDLLIHIKTNHQIEINKIINDEKDYPCRFCNKIYVHKQSRHSHEKICKKYNEKNFKNIKEENIRINEENIKLKEQLLEKTKIIDELMKNNKTSESLVKNIVV